MSDAQSILENFSYLLDPDECNSPLPTSDFEKDALLKFLKEMLIIRICEEKLAEQREAGIIGGPVHLGAGQEAIAVGVSENLSNRDAVFSAHRSHPHLLAMNGSPYKLFAEILGKDTGYSKGMGGSMHLWNEEEGFYGSVPIVAGTVPLAVGAAISSKLLNKKSLGVAYLGDGAVEEGVVAESLNLASIMELPVLFIIENNLFSSHMHISKRQPNPFTARFAIANNIKYEIIDGNDVLQVFSKSNSLINYSRQESKPAFLEAITFRHYGHVDWRIDLDVGVNRSEKDMQKWMKRDPIERLRNGLLENKLITLEEYKRMQEVINYDIDLAWKDAMNASYPHEAELLKRVFKS